MNITVVEKTANSIKLNVSYEQTLSLEGVEANIQRAKDEVAKWEAIKLQIQGGV